MADVFMIGTMYWDLREILSILQQSLYEQQHLKIINKDSAVEFILKLEIIKRL